MKEKKTGKKKTQVRVQPTLRRTRKYLRKDVNFGPIGSPAREIADAILQRVGDQNFSEEIRKRVIVYEQMISANKPEWVAAYKTMRYREVKRDLARLMTERAQLEAELREILPPDVLEADLGVEIDG